MELLIQSDVLGSLKKLTWNESKLYFSWKWDNHWEATIPVHFKGVEWKAHPMEQTERNFSPLNESLIYLLWPPQYSSPTQISLATGSTTISRDPGIVIFYQTLSVSQSSFIIVELIILDLNIVHRSLSNGYNEEIDCSA